MPTGDSPSIRSVVGIFLIVASLLVAAASTGAVAQSAPEITFGNQDITVTNETEVPIVIENVPAEENIGSYELTLEHGSSAVDLSVAGTSRFDVSTDQSDSGGVTSTSIVGYTDQTDGNSGTVALATLTLSPTAANTSTTVSVSGVDSVTDTDGNSVSYSIGSDLSVTVGENTTSDEDGNNTGTGGGGGGVGGVGPGQNQNVSAQVDVVPVDTGATASLSTVPAGADVRVDIDGIISGEDMALEWIDIRHRTAPNDYRIEMTNIGTTPPGNTPALAAATPLGYLDISAINADPDSGRVGVGISESALPAGVSVDDVVIYHYQDSWQALDTEIETTADDYYVLGAETSGFSPFAIGVASADLSVTDASLATTEVETGETVTVSATVTNDGAAEGSLTATLQTDESTLTEQDVSVAAGESADITFETQFDEAGEYSLSVNDRGAGTLVVSDSAPTDNGSADGSDGDGSSGPDAEVPGFGVLTAVLAALVASLLIRRQ